jgi:hypothetical protein
MLPRQTYRPRWRTQYPSRTGRLPRTAFHWFLPDCRKTHLSSVPTSTVEPKLSKKRSQVTEKMLASHAGERSRVDEGVEPEIRAPGRHREYAWATLLPVGPTQCYPKKRRLIGTFVSLCVAYPHPLPVYDRDSHWLRQIHDRTRRRDRDSYPGGAAALAF